MFPCLKFRMNWKWHASDVNCWEILCSSSYVDNIGTLNGWWYSCDWYIKASPHKMNTQSQKDLLHSWNLRWPSCLLDCVHALRTLTTIQNCVNNRYAFDCSCLEWYPVRCFLRRVKSFFFKCSMFTLLRCLWDEFSWVLRFCSVFYPSHMCYVSKLRTATFCIHALIPCMLMEIYIFLCCFQLSYGEYWTML